MVVSSRSASPKQRWSVRDETITAAKETPMVVSSPGAGATPEFK